MRIWVAYKFRGASFEQLRADLETLKSSLQEYGHEMVTMIETIQDWKPDGMPKREAVRAAYDLMKDCDLGLFLYPTANPSEGRGWDAGYMSALGKPTIMAVHKDVSLTYTEALFVENAANIDSWAQPVTRFRTVESVGKQVARIIEKMKPHESNEPDPPEWIKELYGV